MPLLDAGFQKLKELMLYSDLLQSIQIYAPKSLCWVHTFARGGGTAFPQVPRPSRTRIDLFAGLICVLPVPIMYVGGYGPGH